MKKFQKIRGVRDLWGEEGKAFIFVKRKLQDVLLGSGYEEITIPTIESAELFKRSVGEETDIVGKEMYVFKDRSKNILALRPEMTVGIMRAYLEEGLHTQPKPVKLFALGQLFRYERPQKDRYREHYQASVEVLGSAEPIIDAEVIQLAITALGSLGIKDLVVQLNSIGCRQCRGKIHKNLVTYLKDQKRHLSADSKRRLKTNPLRVLDSKEPADQKVISLAPPILDSLCKDCQQHFTELLSYLDALNIPYSLNQRLVRGLDYYTRTVFELWGKQDGFAYAGGGRYDGLVEALGGPKTPGVGFGMGVDRLASLLIKDKIAFTDLGKPDVFLISAGDEAKVEILKLQAKLLGLGWKVDSNLTKTKLLEQLKSADKSGAKVAIIVGEKELAKQEAILRLLDSRTQKGISLAQVSKELGKVIDK